MSTLKIGWSEISITPDKKISLAGQFAERISEYVEKPLTVTALALESGDTQGVIVSCDLGSVAWTLVEDVRARLAENKEGLDPKYVIISAIHTHTGPSYAAPVREIYDAETDRRDRLSSGNAGDLYAGRLQIRRKAEYFRQS